ncbi:MAG: outer membrane beta-barrel family protein, partial [Muribaculaceae bacterium]|nr:outer membrane beta-barrel family protein [Muribaculaceae bacterium]
GRNTSILFTRTCPVSMSFDAAYISPAIQGSGTFNSLWRVDAGLKWQLGRKRCCELTIKADDIFNTWSPTMRIVRSGQDFRMKVRDMTRNVKVTFVWRFNGFKPADMTVDTSRFGTGK